MRSRLGTPIGSRARRSAHRGNAAIHYCNRWTRRASAGTHAICITYWRSAAGLSYSYSYSPPGSARPLSFASFSSTRLYPSRNHYGSRFVCRLNRRLGAGTVSYKRTAVFRWSSVCYSFIGPFGSTNYYGSSTA